MFRESDIEWLRVIGCMKKAGMPLKEIRRYIDLVLKGDDTIDERLDMFRRQREALEARMEELRHTIETVDYKSAGTTKPPRPRAQSTRRATWTTRMSRRNSGRSEMSCGA